MVVQIMVDGPIIMLPVTFFRVLPYDGIAIIIAWKRVTYCYGYVRTFL